MLKKWDNGKLMYYDPVPCSDIYYAFENSTIVQPCTIVHYSTVIMIYIDNIDNIDNNLYFVCDNMVRHYIIIHSSSI